MKTTTKLFAAATIALAMFTGSNLFAQTTTSTMETTSTMSPKTGMDFKIGVGVSGGVTTDNSPFSYALGADLLLQWDLSPNVALTASEVILVSWLATMLLH